jgi:hypothetical protein
LEVFRDKNVGGSLINGPAAWRYRIGGTGREISMAGEPCKGRSSDLFEQLLICAEIPPVSIVGQFPVIRLIRAYALTRRVLTSR